MRRVPRPPEVPAADSFRPPSADDHPHVNGQQNRYKAMLCDQDSHLLQQVGPRQSGTHDGGAQRSEPIAHVYAALRALAFATVRLRLGLLAFEAISSSIKQAGLTVEECTKLL